MTQLEERLAERLATAQRTAWVAAPVEAAVVMEGDLVVQKDGTLARVLEVEPAGTVSSGVGIWLESGPSRKRFTVDPDHPVPVLKRPTPDALDILARQLGAQVMEEKTR